MFYKSSVVVPFHFYNVIKEKTFNIFYLVTIYLKRTKTYTIRKSNYLALRIYILSYIKNEKIRRYFNYSQHGVWGFGVSLIMRFTRMYDITYYSCNDVEEKFNFYVLTKYSSYVRKSCALYYVYKKTYNVNYVPLLSN